MIKYETINGKLCRMVEPEPLTDKAQFPCVVRLIQDETMLGKANIRACHPETLASKRICSELTDDGLFMDGNYTYRYEIIGYPVEEGSAEWALYQIRSGKKVVKEGGGERYYSSLYKNRLFYLNGYGYFVTKNAIGLIDPCSEEEFLGLDETGWQLYTEPKSEPERPPTAH